LLLYSKTWEEHIVLIETILGHKISKDGVSVDTDKTKAIDKMPPPKDAKGVSRFLGCCSFYRKCIKDFSKRSWNQRI